MAMLGVFFGAIVICLLFTQNTNAETVSKQGKGVYNESLINDGQGTPIGYGPIEGGDGNRCSKRNPDACKPKEENPYNRGCEVTNRCHNATI